jgi:hypothetical protein
MFISCNPSSAKGRAMVALNNVDFGNFITHPLMKPPGIPRIEGKVEGDSSSSSSTLMFVKDNVMVDPQSNVVKFFGNYLGARWQFTLSRGNDINRKALIKAEVVQIPNDSEIDFEAIAKELTDVVSTFFNEMVFELDGTFLSFEDMMITAKGKEPSALLSLTITVKKFPSPGLEF